MKDTENQTITTSNPTASSESTFKTDDMNIASFIKAKGGKIIHVGLSSTEGFEKRYYFEFDDAELCTKLKYDYMNNIGGIRDVFEAREMFVKEVKSLGKGFQ